MAVSEKGVHRYAKHGSWRHSRAEHVGAEIHTADVFVRGEIDVKGMMIVCTIVVVYTVHGRRRRDRLHGGGAEKAGET